MSNLLPYGFIWSPFNPNINQAIFEPRYIFPKPLQICSHMASFGHLSVQVWIKQFRTQIHLSRAVANLLPSGFIWTPSSPEINQAIFKPNHTFQNPSQMQNHLNHMLRAIDALTITKPFFVATKTPAHVDFCIVCL